MSQQKRKNNMLTIYKYSLKGHTTKLQIPPTAEVLSAQLQHSTNQICLWVKLDTEAIVKKGREFIVIGTGNDISPVVKLKYIETVQSGLYVWHIFEILGE